jgi:hypothetical protein
MDNENLVPDRARDSQRRIGFGRETSKGSGISSSKYFTDKTNIAAVSRTGGEPKVRTRTPEETGPRDTTKFDKSNPAHVKTITSGDKNVMIHPGGSFSTPGKEKKKAPAKKAPAKEAGLISFGEKQRNKEAARREADERRNQALRNKKK